MSLLKWKELAKRKSELGNKINYVHDTITEHDLGQKTSQESFTKVFKPVNTKLDDVIVSNWEIPKRQLKRGKKGDINNIDYYPEVDPYKGLIDFGDYVPPQKEKQIVPKPPRYEESLKDVLEGNKQIHIDPQYFPKEQEMPPEYEEDDEIDYALDEEDRVNELLDDMDIKNYDDVEKQLDQTDMTPPKAEKHF